MRYEYEFLDEGPFDVVVTVAGEVSYEELRAGRARLLADPRFVPGLDVLVDHEHLHPEGATSADMRALAQSAGREWGGAGVGYLVMVAPRSLTFGLLRMWQTLLSDEFAARAAVVASVEEAHAWLASRPKPASD